MDIREEILKEHSKAQVVRITQYIGNDPKRFKALMDLFFHDEYRVTQRLAWVLTHVGDQHPELVVPYMEQLVEAMGNSQKHVAVKRNVIRFLAKADIPEELMGIVADQCFQYLADPKEPAAIRVFSMTVLYNICQKEPYLANELRLLIEEHLPYATAGFKSRGKKILIGLKKIEETLG